MSTDPVQVSTAYPEKAWFSSPAFDQFPASNTGQNRLGQYQSNKREHHDRLHKTKLGSFCVLLFAYLTPAGGCLGIGT
jgi:hypothetical protein